MKKNFLLLTTAMVCIAATAQMKEGTIVYEKKTNLHRSIQDEQMRAMIPEFRTEKFILLFSDSVSMYKAQPEDEAPDPFAGGGGTRMVMRFGGDGGETFRNYAAQKSVALQELGARNYLIEDSIRTLKWKMTDETKKIKGHVCHKATAKQTVMVGNMRIVTSTNNGNGNTHIDTSKANPNAPQKKEIDVVAWYADDVTVPAGPANYCGLPGAILEVDVDNGATVFTVAELKSELNKKELKEPTKGKKVTQDEFRKMQMEMMQNMGGGSGGRVMRFGGN